MSYPKTGFVGATTGERDALSAELAEAIEWED